VLNIETMSIDEILEQLPRLTPQQLEEVSQRAQFLRALREGIKDIDEANLVPHEQVKRELAQWLSPAPLPERS
jgi:predicted transcriptional regulator